MLTHYVGYYGTIAAERPQRSFFVLCHEAAIANDIRCQNRSKTPGTGQFH